MTTKPQKIEGGMEKRIEDILFNISENGVKFGQGKLSAKSEVGRREVAVEGILRLMKGYSKKHLAKMLTKTRIKAHNVKDLSESSEGRDKYHFWKGWKKAREVLSTTQQNPL